MPHVKIFEALRYIFILSVLMICTASHAVNKNKINQVLDKSGLKYTWPQNSSLWIENPGSWTKLEMEKAGHMLCRIDRGFIVTWWQDINGPRGQILKIRCL